MSRICEALEVSRSNLYERLKKPSGIRKRRVMIQDQKLLPLIRQITDERPTYGYRRITVLLRKTSGQPINPKRVYRIMKEHSLLLQKHGMSTVNENSPPLVIENSPTLVKKIT